MPAATAEIGAREASAGTTRRAILKEAEHLLARGGEAGLSIRELCARTGVTAPTIYHHFGDKGALIDRIVDACFAEFGRSFAHRTPPTDPVEALRWGFDRYVEFARRHPTHYRLMFQRTAPRAPTPAGLGSYDRLRRSVAGVAEARRLTAPLEDATAALWSAMHGVASLGIAGALRLDSPAVALVRDGMLAQLTRPARRPRRRRKEG
jgi:AcrR family transcriptional regulator